VAGALAALELLRERPHRVQRLRSNARVLRQALAAEGFPVADSEMQIVPLIVGDERAAMRLCQDAIERGVFAQAIRPPTVPAGTSRLRLTAMASHTPAELRRAAGLFGELARKQGLDPTALSPGHEERPAEPEPAYAEESVYAQVSAQAREHSHAEHGDAPFDLERDGGEVAVTALARASAPFDVERESAAGARAA
jgi:glycine C-acetyltransferase/8-amino-7-oxononanoate synthase